MNYTVLVVDDEEDQRHALIQRVDWKTAGFRVIGEAENGVEALELVETLEPDLVLTDIKMPMMSGLELAARIREIRPATQIVILSGYDRFEYAQTAIKYNIISYLLKPISSREFSNELLKIRGRMDERFESMTKSPTVKEDENSKRLGKTEFLLPLILGNSEKVTDESVLKMRAEKLGLINGETNNFAIFVSKFKNAQNKNCTTREHISFVSAIIDKYVKSESFFVSGRIVTFAVSKENDISSALGLPVLEIVQSAKRVLQQTCTIGVSREFKDFSDCSNAYFQAVTARRYTADGTSDVRFIDDQEHDSEFEFEYVEKSVFKLEQLLKVGTKEDLQDFLKSLYESKNKESADFLIIQILATVYRTVSAVSDKPALTELVSSNPIYAKTAFYDSEKNMRSDLTNLCFNAMDIISKSRKRDTEILCDKVLQIIDEEYGKDDLSLTGVSTRLAVSPNYLSALIKKTKKKNFVALVTERRMKAAYDMLTCTSMKIHEISEKCGYNDQHYFSYCFKKFYGRSPNKIREGNLEV